MKPFTAKKENRLRELSDLLFAGDQYKIFTHVDENSPEMKEYNALVAEKQLDIAWNTRIIVGHCYYRKGDRKSRHFVSHKNRGKGTIEVQSTSKGLETFTLDQFIQTFNL